MFQFKEFQKNSILTAILSDLILAAVILSSDCVELVFHLTLDKPMLSCLFFFHTQSEKLKLCKTNMLLKSLLGAVQWLWFVNDVNHSGTSELLTLQVLQLILLLTC